MSDILVLATPDDADRVGGLVDALVRTGVAGPYRTRLMSAAPEDPGTWNDIVQVSESCPCVIFCWSKHTTTREMKPLRALGASVFGERRAISVELDPRTRPTELRLCTTYPLSGWRALPRWSNDFIFGSHFVTQIAAAAQEKVIGRDPPPPSGYARMVRAQVWAVLVGGGALIGFADDLIEMVERVASAKWRHPEMGAAYEAALASPRPCDAMRDFLTKNRGSAWATEASERILTCTKRPVTDTVRVTETLAVFGETRADAERDAKAVCEGRAKLTGATLQSVTLESFEARGRSTTRCELDEPRLESVETMGGPGK